MLRWWRRRRRAERALAGSEARLAEAMRQPQHDYDEAGRVIPFEDPLPDTLGPGHPMFDVMMGTAEHGAVMGEYVYDPQTGKLVGVEGRYEDGTIVTPPDV